MFRQRSDTPSDSPPAKIAPSNSVDSAASANASNAEASSTVAGTSQRRFGLSEIANLFIRLRRHQSRANLASAQRQNQEASAPNATTPAATEAAATTESPVAEALTLPPQGVPLGPHPIDDNGRVILTPPAHPTRNRVRRLTGELTRSPYGRSRSTSASKLKPHHIVSSSGNVPITQPGIRETMLLDGPRIPVTYTDRFEVAGGVNTPTLLRATKRSILEAVEHMGLGVNALADEKWECTICGPKNKVNYKVQIDYSATAVRCTRQDSFRPVALDRAKTVPGLMTILTRNED